LCPILNYAITIPAILGFTILFGEFKYRTVFKHLFIAGGASGKAFYLIVSLLMWVFLFFIIRLFLPTIDQSTSADINTAWFVTLGGFIYCVGKYGNESYKQLRALNYEKTKAELMALKAQINPHFLFNILNNLYGSAIVEDSPKTAEGIQQLSRIMRHVVEETKTKRSPIEKEIAFLNDYIDLQKMRIPDRPNIKIKTTIDWDQKPYQIASLLFVPYIENAFKYGISVNEPCFIDLKISISEGVFQFEINNSIIKKVDKLEEGTGTGLENTARRLALYYPSQHKLNVDKTDNIFSVKATVKIA
jgi:sensor histidine kinase YesM